jgi:hypothetical protein
MNFLMVSGVAETRLSPSAVSFRTAIFTPRDPGQDEMMITTNAAMMKLMIVPHFIIQAKDE